MTRQWKIPTWMKAFLGFYALFACGILIIFVFFPSDPAPADNSLLLPSSLQTAKPTGTQDQDLFFVYFRESVPKPKQQEILKLFPEVTYRKNGFFDAITEVSIKGNVKNIAARMRKNDAIILIRGGDGGEVCH